MNPMTMFFYGQPEALVADFQCQYCDRVTEEGRYLPHAKMAVFICKWCDEQNIIEDYKVE